MEDRHRNRPEVEVVVLGAESADSLHRTHARYFTSAHELLHRGVASV
jgi:hypothetical protein